MVNGRRLVVVAVIVAALTVACTPEGTGGGGTSTTMSATTTIAVSLPPLKLLGYFTEWGIYARDYQPKNLVTSGAASKVSHINVAFGNVVNGQCAAGDAYAETGKVYAATNSVDGLADSASAGALHGVFGQLVKLKASYPNLKVLWSFGGASWSSGFARAALNPLRGSQGLTIRPEWRQSSMGRNGVGYRARISPPSNQRVDQRRLCFGGS